jgi:hypothetical protein
MIGRSLLNVSEGEEVVETATLADGEPVEKCMTPAIEQFPEPLMPQVSDTLFLISIFQLSFKLYFPLFWRAKILIKKLSAHISIKIHRRPKKFTIVTLL